jgi:hypothetical protein
MTYVLPNTFLAAKRLKKIAQRAFAVTLCKGGYVSTFPHAVANGPNLYGGIAMHPLPTKQLLEQTKAVLKHLWCNGENCDMLCITLSWAQLGTGMGFPILACPKTSVPHLEYDLMQSLRTGLTTIEARIECYNSFVYKPRHITDSHIMDAICKSPQSNDANI